LPGLQIAAVNSAHEDPSFTKHPDPAGPGTSPLQRDSALAPTQGPVGPAERTV